MIDERFKLPSLDLIKVSIATKSETANSYITHVITLKLNDEKFDKIKFKNCKTPVIQTELTSGDKLNYVMVKNENVLEFCKLLDIKIKEVAKSTLGLDLNDETYNSIVTKPGKKDQTETVFVPIKAVNGDIMAPIILHKDTKLPLLSDIPLTQEKLRRYNDDFDKLVKKCKNRKPFNYITSMYSAEFGSKKRIDDVSKISEERRKEMLESDTFIDKMNEYSFILMSFRFGKLMYKSGGTDIQVGKYFASGCIEPKTGGAEADFNDLRGDIDEMENEEKEEKNEETEEDGEIDYGNC